MADHKEIPPRIADPTYQDKDINLKALVFSIVGTLIVVAFSFWAMKKLFDTYDKNMYQTQETAVKIPVERQLPPEPRLQIDEKADLIAYKDQEDMLIDERAYGWIDKDAGKLRMPVAQAMKVVVKEGLPTRKQ